MSRWALPVLLLALGGCAREVDLGAVGATTEGTSAGGSCRTDGDCGSGQRCLAGACTVVAASCDPLEACATSDGTFCAGSCPTCTSGERCCMDNGFGQCQCFCGLSCAAPSCAPAGVDPGPRGASCSGSADCLCGETCNGGTCQAGPVTVTCASDLDCQLYGCDTDACVGGRCVPPGWQCVNDRECGAVGSGESCVSGGCQCVSHAGKVCGDSSACSACAGERCQQGFCSVFTTSSGGTSGATAGNAAATSGGATTGGITTSSGGTTGTGTIGGSTGSTFGTSTVGSGSTGSGCACGSDADCNDAYHEGYVCGSSGICQPGPAAASLSSTGGLCAVGGSSGSSSTSGTGTSGSSSGSGGGFASSTGGTT